MNKQPWQGIQVRVHFLFWVVIVSSVLTGRFIEVITLFVLVIIHELGHITAAHSFGWRIQSMELLPFGGVAHTNEWGTVSAREEMVVALAGPFHNVMMILAGLLFYKAGWWTGEWTEYFVQGNAVMAGFNLLPIYPLDGGRIIQSLLSFSMSYRRSIQWSVQGSLFLSFCLLAFGLFRESVHFNLCLVALFLIHSNFWAMKHKEFQYLRFLMNRKEISAPYTAEIRKVRVSRQAPLRSVLKEMRKESYHVYLVQNTKGEWMTIPEEVLLERFFEDKMAQSVMGDLVA